MVHLDSHHGITIGSFTLWDIPFTITLYHSCPSLVRGLHISFTSILFLVSSALNPRAKKPHHLSLGVYNNQELDENAGIFFFLIKFPFHFVFPSGFIIIEGGDHHGSFEEEEEEEEEIVWRITCW